MSHKKDKPQKGMSHKKDKPQKGRNSSAPMMEKASVSVLKIRCELLVTRRQFHFSVARAYLAYWLLGIVAIFFVVRCLLAAGVSWLSMEPKMCSEQRRFVEKLDRVSMTRHKAAGDLHISYCHLRQLLSKLSSPMSHREDFVPSRYWRVH